MRQSGGVGWLVGETVARASGLSPARGASGPAAGLGLPARRVEVAGVSGRGGAGVRDSGRPAVRWVRAEPRRRAAVGAVGAVYVGRLARKCRSARRFVAIWPVVSGLARAGVARRCRSGGRLSPTGCGPQLQGSGCWDVGGAGRRPLGPAPSGGGDPASVGGVARRCRSARRLSPIGPDRGRLAVCAGCARCPDGYPRVGASGLPRFWDGQEQPSAAGRQAPASGANARVEGRWADRLSWGTRSGRDPGVRCC